jgi:hypothetical protein
MQKTPYLGRVAPGMSVCDTAGKKIGTIVQVHNIGDAPPATPAAGAAALPHNQVMEIKTGLLGLGPHLYIPTSAIDDGLEDSVFLSQPKEEFERLGWHEKPPALSESP